MEFSEVLMKCLIGWLGVFIVTIVIILLITLLNYLTKND